MLDVVTREELLCGDIWVTIDYPEYEFGLFCQVEEDGDTEGLYHVYVYENVAEGETDYSATLLTFNIFSECYIKVV